MSEAAQLKELSGKINQARSEIAKMVIGQDNVIDLTMTTLMAGGHVLLIGAPGLAKTLLVTTVAQVMGLSSNRIQCTPDLMPSDILGSEVLEEENGKRAFRFIAGPIFTQFLMADEINRASPRTQSALLQAMQEGYVSIAGQHHQLPSPFHVLATQNPIEQEGTYPLPEAQLDRFLMQIDVDYPDETAERKILLATTGNEIPNIKTIFTGEDLINIQKLVRDMPIGEKTLDAIVTLVRRARPGEEAIDLINDYVEWAPGPRASQALALACRAKALLDGRTAPSNDDVLDLAEPILKHRMALNYKAQANGITIKDIIAAISKDI